MSEPRTLLFNSYIVLCASLPVTLTGYGLLAHGGRVPAALWLVALSFVFYGWLDPWFAPCWPDRSAPTMRSRA